MTTTPYRLATVNRNGTEAILIEIEGSAYYLADVLPSLEPHLTVLDIIGAWDVWETRLAELVAGAPAAASVSPDHLSFLSPVTKPPKLICIGTNYHDHLREMHVSKPPEYPYGFMRPLTSLAGHRETVPLPDWPKMVDWEAELGVVIGRRAHGLSTEEALDAVFGYTIINDISARDWIENRPFVGVDWVMQKAWDAFQPTGPWITPAAFIANPQELAIELTVNGIVRQSSNTAEMIFSVADIIVHLSRIMTLEPGDIIATGTPAGVGFGQNPRLSLADGDEMIVSIEGLGEPLRNRIVSVSAAAQAA